MVKILPFDSISLAGHVVATAERRLRESPYFFLKGLTCRFDSGLLTLRGTVPMWQLREFAESIVARVEGVQQVENQVEVFDPMQMPFSERAAHSAG